MSKKKKKEKQKEVPKGYRGVVVKGVYYEIKMHDKPDKLFEWEDGLVHTNC